MNNNEARHHWPDDLSSRVSYSLYFNGKVQGNTGRRSLSSRKLRPRGKSFTFSWLHPFFFLVLPSCCVKIPSKKIQTRSWTTRIPHTILLSTPSIHSNIRCTHSLRKSWKGRQEKKEMQSVYSVFKKERGRAQVILPLILSYIFSLDWGQERSAPGSSLSCMCILLCCWHYTYFHHHTCPFRCLNCQYLFKEVLLVVTLEPLVQV